MCDYSLHSIKSRPAKIDDKLTTRDFGTGTRGFAASENPNVAVCVLPGTELAFIFAAEDFECWSPSRETGRLQRCPLQSAFDQTSQDPALPQHHWL